MTLHNKAALVTGASRGIGRAIAVALAQAGADVVVNYRERQDAAETTADAIRQAGTRALSIQADVRDADAVKAMVAATKQAFGRIDILVNNAGILHDNLVTFMTEQQWDEVLDTNLKGAFHAIKAVTREMARQRAGRIINITSDAGLMGDSMRANYSAAKAGLIGLTKAVAREVAASGVTVNAVAPGLIETELIAEVADAKKARQLDLIPLKRYGTPQDVAALVVFLASDVAAYITGQVVCVDGGLRM